MPSGRSALPLSLLEQRHPNKRQSMAAPGDVETRLGPSVLSRMSEEVLAMCKSVDQLLHSNHTGNLAGAVACVSLGTDGGARVGVHTHVPEASRCASHCQNTGS